MPLSNTQRLRILGAIEQSSLVFLCGAGLSIPAPASLFSAVRVSRTCFDRWLPNEQLEPRLRDDIDGLARHFHQRGELGVFNKLVPWDELVGPPNRGHASIADFLICRAAHSALSANFDFCIESWAHGRKVA